MIFGNTHIFFGFPHLDALAIDLKGFFTDLPSYLRQQENDPLVKDPRVSIESNWMPKL